MLNQILSLTKELISIKSISSNPKELKKCLDLALSKVDTFTVEKFESKGVRSALIYNSDKRPEMFKVILNCHLDVIPAKEYQYFPIVKNNKLYGAGAMDMKANVACAMYVFKEVASKIDYPLALQLVTDEEVGGENGTKYQIDKGVKGEFIVATETTNLNVVNKTKGVIWAEISTKGTTAHGAYPWKGKNAVWKMARFLNGLEKKFPVPTEEKWSTTINLSSIESTNQSFNKIPDDCTVKLDIRYTPEDAKSIINSIEKIVPAGFKIKILAKEPCMYSEETNSYVLGLKAAGEEVLKRKVILYGAHGSSDARHYFKVNGKGVEFGAVGGGIGSDQEWISIPSLEQYSKVLEKFLLNVHF